MYDNFINQTKVASNAHYVGELPFEGTGDFEFQTARPINRRIYSFRPSMKMLIGSVLGCLGRRQDLPDERLSYICVKGVLVHLSLPTGLIRQSALDCNIQ